MGSSRSARGAVSERDPPLIGILHYTCPPIVGGVELIMAQHARLLRAAGHGVRVLAGRGGRFRRDLRVELIPAPD